MALNRTLGTIQAFGACFDPEKAENLKMAHLAGRPLTVAISDCVARLNVDTPLDYREIAGLLASEWAARPPGLVGLAGGQGAGKTTLARVIASACAEFDLRVCVLSLDDFVFPLSRRRALAQDVHPLLETRGPPGTHDMRRVREALTRLQGLGNKQEVALPIFDKGLDDRRGSRLESGPFDIVLLEGWCVGARAETKLALAEPINSLEKMNDGEGIWRRFVNAALADSYAETWRQLDYLIYLRVPELASVRRWRLEQENERPETQRMDEEAIDRFVQHYERTTLAMDRDLPEMADLMLTLSENHLISGVKFRSLRPSDE
jgi:D-glycerate 3-kinase